MVTAYEAMFIVDATLPEDQLKGVLDKYTGVLTKQGGEIDDIDIWDPRRLAYEIKGRREGRYIVVNFRSEPAAKDEMTRIFGISDDTLRSVIVRQDPRADRFPSRIRVADAERREREAAARAVVEPPVVAAPPPVTELPAPAEEPEATKEPEATVAPEATEEPEATVAPETVDGE